jgi:hypothetical protein
MQRTALCTFCGIILTFVIACSVHSQVVNVWPGVAPGSEKWTYKEYAVAVND